MELGNKLKELRKEHNYSQNQLADKLNVTAQAVSKWENNKCAPDIINLIQLSDLYNVSLDYLIKSDKELQSQLSVENIRLKVLKYFILCISLILIFVLFILIKSQFFMFGHGLGTWILIVCLLIFTVSIFFSLYCYIVKKNHFISLWIAFLMLSCIVCLTSFYDYIMKVIFS
ncbi:helix-turn-helix domain-containing protein [Bacillus pseudomycoides]|uniref:helix-turn-helix domain-containing protein n=1 Tax=Bacillus pseudomycoides TaxID=64104 RepID=UPI0020D22BC2|nr:helix-turn-helix transcriptional regulator [Bacillus pseudomycoides]